MNDIFGLKIALDAADQSTDPSTQVGCALIRVGDGILAASFNGLVADIADFPERRTSPLKQFFVAHAETSAIHSCARSGIKTQGAWLYCTYTPCANCAQAIIEAGIDRVIIHKQPNVHPAWVESCGHALQMMEESRVAVNYVEHHYGRSLRLAGEMVTV